MSAARKNRGRGWQAVLGPHNAACLHIIIFIEDGMKFPDFNPKLHYYNAECKKKIYIEISDLFLPLYMQHL